MLKRYWRHLLFFLFVAGFLISAPLVVLHTAGYRYHLGSGKIVQTGVLNVSSIPRGASIYVDGQLQKERTPAVIDNILPGSHLVRIEKSEYSSWEKTLEVRSRKSTFVSQVVLFLSQEAEFSPTVSDLTPLVHVPTGTLFYPKQLEVNNEQAWSSDGRFIQLQRQVMQTKTGQIILTLLPNERFEFDVNDKNRGYLFSENTVHVVQLETGEKTLFPLQAQAIESADAHHLIQNSADRSVLSQIDSNQIATIIAYLPLSTYRFITTPSPYLLLQDTKRDRLILVNPNERSEPILLNAEVKEWTWSLEEPRLLFTDGFDVEVYSPQSHTRETVTRFSQPIQGLHWYPEGNVAIFKTEGAIFAQELDRRGSINKTTLMTGLSGSGFWFEENGKWLVGLTSDNEKTKIFRKRLQR